ADRPRRILAFDLAAAAGLIHAAALAGIPDALARFLDALVVHATGNRLGHGLVLIDHAVFKTGFRDRLADRVADVLVAGLGLGAVLRAADGLVAGVVHRPSDRVAAVAVAGLVDRLADRVADVAVAGLVARLADGAGDGAVAGLVVRHTD